MIKRNSLVLLAGLLALVALPFSAFAQTGSTNSQTSPGSSVGESVSQNSGQDDLSAVQTIEANAGPDRQGVVGREIIFTAEDSLVPEGKTPRYIWNVGEGIELEGEAVRHTYSRPGVYTVTLTASVDGQFSTDFKQVSIFENSVILITDPTTTEEEVDELRRQAEREDRLLIVIEDRDSTTDFAREDKLTQLLLDQVESVRVSDIIIDWTSGDTGLNVLSKFAQQLPDIADVDVSEKAIVSMASPVAVTARIAQSTFDVLGPQYILLTMPTALDAVLEAQGSDQVLSEVQQTGTELRLIGEFSSRSISELTPLNFMSYFVNYMISEGVPVNSILLILMLPVIATIFAFARQVVGLRAFGIYIPTIVTLSFLALGLINGLTVFFVVLVIGTLLRFLIRKVRINYIPRLALVLTGVSFAILGLLALGGAANQPAITALAIFPILIMVALAEQFVAAQIEQGFTTAVLLTLETLILSILTYALVSWDPFQSLILAYPELILLTILINIALGRWTGLRLTEYFRFRQIRRFTKLP